MIFLDLAITLTVCERLNKLYRPLDYLIVQMSPGGTYNSLAFGAAKYPRFIESPAHKVLGYFFSFSDLPQNTDKKQHRFSIIYPNIKFKSML